MSECVVCETPNNIVQHHLNYEKDITVPVCRSCHGKIHKDNTHVLYPDDAKTGKTLIHIDAYIRDRLKDLKRSTETYNDVLLALLATSDREVTTPPEDELTIDVETRGNGYINLPGEAQMHLDILCKRAKLRVHVEVIDREETTERTTKRAAD